MVGDSDPDTKKGMSRAQEACRVTVQKDPCWRESKLSLKCLDDNSYNKSLCQAEFENYKQCKTFWNQVSWARRKEGRFPLVPESEEERAAFKMKYRETRKIPTEV